MKKIIITTESLCIGGVETSLLSLVKLLAINNFEIDLYYLNDGDLYNEFINYANLYKIDIKHYKNNIFNRILKNLLFNIKYNNFSNEDYDFSIAYYGINNYSDLFALKNKANEKFIWVHNTLQYTGCNFIKKIIYYIKNLIVHKKYQKFDNIVCVSNSSKENFLKLYPELEDKTIVVNNLIDYSIVDKSKEKVDIILNEKKKICYIGRLIKSKCVDKLIINFETFLKKYPDAYLYIIGDGPERKQLEILSNKIGISDNIVFIGYQINPYKYLKKMDMLVTYSKLETYGLTLIEAAVLGVYFISFNNCGAIDVYNILQKNKNLGIVCEEEEIIKEMFKYYDNKRSFIDVGDLNENFKKQILFLFKKK